MIHGTCDTYAFCTFGKKYGKIEAHQLEHIACSVNQTILVKSGVSDQMALITLIYA